MTTPPISNEVFTAQLANAGDISSAVELAGLVANRYVTFVSDDHFFILFGDSSVPDLDDTEVASTPSSPQTDACWKVYKETPTPFMITDTATQGYFKWEATAASQVIRYYYSSPEGA